jgi:hypothetical protein
MEANEAKVQKFLRDYYSSRDYSIWLARIKYAAKRLDELKTDGKRRGYILDLYSSYLQLTEILLTNIRIATTREKEILKTLFISNGDLRKFFAQAQYDPRFYQWFLTNFDFAIKEKEQINLYKQKFDEHEEILKEVIKDYLADYEFLNAYKHGYRVSAALSPKHDAQLKYLSRERATETKGEYIILENEINFKVVRVYLKATFTTAMLDNLRLILGNNPGEKVNLVHYFFKDRTVWDKSFGTSRVRRQIF